MPSDPHIVSDPTKALPRMSAADRLVASEKNANSLYTKFSVYDQNPTPKYGFGAKQPYVFTNVASSNSAKSRTEFDSQTFPIGSTINDVQRVTKFSTSGQGLLFIGKQYLMQQANAFNETRIYNPISLISATAAQGSAGLIDRPTRFLASNGTLGDMVASSLLSFVGIQSKSMDSKPSGVATGAAISTNASVRGGANKGLLRNQTGTTALNNFNSTWASSTSGGDKGFLGNLGSSMINRLKSMIPSTKPFGIGSDSTTWDIRPEYKDKDNGVYESFLTDSRGLLSVASKPQQDQAANTSKGFFGQLKSGLSSALFGSPSTTNQATGGISVAGFHRYTPKKQYAGKETDVNGMERSVMTPEGIDRISKRSTSLKSINNQITALKEVSEAWSSKPVSQIAMSAERYVGLTDDYLNPLNSYKDIPTTSADDSKTFEGKLKDVQDKKTTSFSTAGAKVNGSYIKGDPDSINVLTFSKTIARGNPMPSEYMSKEKDQSLDVIFFYFYDIVNERYIPFRATISGINEVNGADWEEVQYIGRADKLYLYKGYSRDLNFSFKVYASSLQELIPMWTRINYLVGLTRPSKYTSAGTVRAIGSFMIPPMVSIRVGDMYNDQPGILRSVSITVPDDANWESFRGMGDKYGYLKGALSAAGLNYGSSVQSLQLPMQVDVSITMNLLEKERCATFDENGSHLVDHYNLSDPVIK